MVRLTDETDHKNDHKNILTRRARARHASWDVHVHVAILADKFLLCLLRRNRCLLSEDVIYETDVSFLSHRDYSGCRFLALRERTGQQRRPETLSWLEQLQPANHPRRLSDASEHDHAVRRTQSLGLAGPRLRLYQPRFRLAGQLRREWQAYSGQHGIP